MNLAPFGSAVPPCSAWGHTDDDRTRSCLVLPMTAHTGSDKAVGVLVAGVNPRHELDDNYRYASHLLSSSVCDGTSLRFRAYTQCAVRNNSIFFNLFANNVSSIIMNATAREEERQRAEVAPIPLSPLAATPCRAVF